MDLLRGHARLAAALEGILVRDERMTAVEANPLTGRLLVRFDPSLASDAVESLLRAAVSAALSISPRLLAIGTERPTSQRESDRRSRMIPSLPAVLAFGFGAALLPKVLAAGAATWWILGAAALAAGAAVTATRPTLTGRGREGLTTLVRSSPSTRTRHPLLRLMRYAEAHRSEIYKASAFSVINKIMDLGPPLLVGMAVSVVTSNGSPLIAALGVASPVLQLGLIGVLASVIWSLESLFEYYSNVKWHRIAQAIQDDLRLDTYAHVQRIELSHLEDETTGGLASILNDDVNQLELFINEGANDLIQNITNFVVVGGLFLWIAPSVAWINLLPIPLIVGGSFYYQKKLGPKYARVREASGRLSSQLVSNLGGMATIESFTAEEHEVDRIRGLSKEYVAANRDATALIASFTPLIRMAVLIGFAGSLVLGGVLALGGGLSAGAYTVLVYLTTRFLWPLTSLGFSVELHERSMAAFDRVLGVLAAPVGPAGGDQPLPLEQVRGEVIFEDVHFAYPRRPPVLEALTMRILEGETTALVGATGAGKTTIVKLLLRFYEYGAGRISIDGYDIRDLRVGDLRRAIGLVSQDAFLFPGTVLDNIVYGRRDSPREQVVEAARIAEADEFIRALPDGYDTLIGERGLNVSGGQRQRLCLARAVLKNPPILVLDEATSSVDNETEAAIQRSLERLAVGRTTLVIAHRLSTVRNAHQIYVMGTNGEILERGRHQDLLDQNGFYASLWRVQSGSAVGGPTSTGGT